MVVSDAAMRLRIPAALGIFTYVLVACLFFGVPSVGVENSFLKRKKYRQENGFYRTWKAIKCLLFEPNKIHYDTQC